MAANCSSYEPLSRFGHAAVAVGSKLYMWRGVGPKKNIKGVASTVEQFDVTTELWEQKSIYSTPPPGLANAANTVVGTSLYSFGGFDGKCPSNILYQLDLHTFQWNDLRGRNPSSRPQGKLGCRMVSYGDNQLIVFAGKRDSGCTNEVHIFDLDKGEWSSPPVTGTKPPPRYNFSFTKIDNRRAVVYGGVSSEGPLGDAYVLELDTLHWSELDTRGCSPCARWGHAACCIAGPLTGEKHPLLLVERGCIDGAVFKDIWILDVERRVWNKVALPKVMEPRCSHTATVFSFGPNFRVLVLFGGRRRVGGDPVAETTLLYVEQHRETWEVTKVVTKEELGKPAERLEKRSKLQLLATSNEKVNNSEKKNEGRHTMLEQMLIVAEERIAELQQTAEARAQEIDALRQRAEEADRKARDAENTATVLIRQTTNANQRAREAEARAQERATQADQRATQADQRATQADQRATQADERAAQADQRATQADHRATQADQRATQADQRAMKADQRATQADQRATQADHRAIQGDQKATQAEQRAHLLQQQLEEAGLRIREAERRVQDALETARTAEERNRMLETRGCDQYWVVHREEIQLTNKELGRGGWAVVREAKFRGLKVAAKCLHTFIISDYNRQLFVREMSIAARVRHPNLVQFIGSTMEGEPIILTELMATSLRAVLERGLFNHTQVMAISLDVARALNYLHLMQPDPIIHRDVSSANVLLEPGPSNSWRAKVSDYGSANFLQQLTTAGPGNPTYASPEAGIPSQQSPKMDVFSYGILLLEICSQRFPDLEERGALLQRVHQPAMVALIRQCLEQDPNGRPNMSEIIGQLE